MFDEQMAELKVRAKQSIKDETLRRKIIEQARYNVMEGCIDSDDLAIDGTASSTTTRRAVTG